MLEKYYKSVDEIPLFNWIECTQGNFNYVLHDENNTSKIEDSKLEEIFNTIFDSYIQKNGISKTYERLLKLIRKRALLQLDYTINLDRFNLTKIELCDAEIETMKKSTDRGISIQETLVILSKWIGYRLDWKVISKGEFDTILKTYTNDKKQENGEKNTI